MKGTEIAKITGHYFFSDVRENKLPDRAARKPKPVDLVSMSFGNSPDPSVQTKA
jgi:hypothetical protein